MNFRHFTVAGRVAGALAPFLRLLVYPGEVYRLPEAGQCMRIVSGRAWLTAQGRDMILEAEQRACLAPAAEAALVSALGGAPVVLEVRN